MNIAIVGGAPSYHDTPWSDPDLAGWTLGMHWTFCERVDRIFEMHARAIWGDYLNVDPDAYARRLNAAGVPVTMRETWGDIPTSEPFPFDDIAARWRPLWGSSFDYLISAALFAGATAVRLYGVTMEPHREYAHQRASASYWLGVAEELGVDVWIHPTSHLLRTLNPHPYGSRMWHEAGADAAERARTAGVA